MSQVSNISSVVGAIDLGPTGSLQFQFAKLQLALAELSKNNALDYIDQIQKSQDEQKKVAMMLQQARQAQANAKAQGDKGKTEMPSELQKYMDDNGLAYEKGKNKTQLETDLAQKQKLLDDNTWLVTDYEKELAWYASITEFPAGQITDRVMLDKRIKSVIAQLAGHKSQISVLSAEIKQIKAELAKPLQLTKDEWEVAITSLKAQLDQLGTDTQQKMVFVQDFMGQYNSYLQGANSAIQQANQTLAELARVR